MTRLAGNPNNPHMWFYFPDVDELLTVDRLVKGYAPHLGDNLPTRNFFLLAENFQEAAQKVSQWKENGSL